jgi:IS4 transposase
VFITNLSVNIRPGAIAFLYKCRWNIEKTYNTFKHKLGEQRAWAVTPVAKMAQENFICLAYNLSLFLNRRFVREAPEPKLSPNHIARKKRNYELTI